MGQAKRRVRTNLGWVAAYTVLFGLAFDAIQYSNFEVYLHEMKRMSRNQIILENADLIHVKGLSRDRKQDLEFFHPGLFRDFFWVWNGVRSVKAEFLDGKAVKVTTRT